MNKVEHDAYHTVLSSYISIFENPKYTLEEQAKYTNKIIEWHMNYERLKKKSK